MIRLDKYLADMGVGTRTQVKDMLKKGLVTVDDIIVKDPGLKIDTTALSIIKVSGEVISYSEYEYYMLNKPAGVITATSDKKQSTVMDLVKGNRKDMFPVGRLDKDTEGLLLITNDGDLAHELLAPKKHVDKTYYAELLKDVSDNYIKEFSNGIVLKDGIKTMPAVLRILDKRRVELTIHEGKYHQVKRMFEATGNKVTYLKRLSMGSLTLDETLPLGGYRPLTENEINSLKAICNKKGTLQ